MATFFNPFLPGGNSIHTEGNLQLKFAGLLSMYDILVPPGVKMS